MRLSRSFALPTRLLRGNHDRCSPLAPIEGERSVVRGRTPPLPATPALIRAPPPEGERKQMAVTFHPGHSGRTHPWEGEAPAEPHESSFAVRLSRSFALPTRLLRGNHDRCSPLAPIEGERSVVRGRTPPLPATPALIRAPPPEGERKQMAVTFHPGHSGRTHPWEGEAPAEPHESSFAVRLSRSFALPTRLPRGNHDRCRPSPPSEERALG